MARAFVRSTSSLFTIATAPVTGYPFSMACWVNTTNATPGGNQDPLVFQNSSSTTHDNLGIAIDNATGKLEGYVSNTTTFSFAVVGSALSTNTWYPAVFSCTSATNRTMYSFQSGSLVSVNDTTNITPTGTTNQGNIGGYATTEDVGGSVAECALWNVALTLQEATSFCQGVRAYNIRPASLKGYWPLDGLVSPEPDLSGAAHNMTKAAAGTLAPLGFGPPFVPFTPLWPQANNAIIPVVATAFKPWFAIGKNVVVEGVAT